ncbi:MAG: hypothetical protein A2161_13555 [Candidatus Schekmanbacteria bacterium RBG_13_48_7]|uniref:Epoxyqueuosine reductase QueH n=1 Tax=Candidatus Schekmanbacteria bacterium RBG_13_48_7 TaxID=1817878 RepID=A0A1F7RSV7_9BACT|nr:MAG: hypothetical protein A2161_13555 [Candidatus Schekmanbacteria bacterium RBG_13_48_7]
MKPLIIPPDQCHELKDMNLLIHVCCAPDAVYIFKELRTFLKVYAFFYNPNIYPENEYDKRRIETDKVCKYLNIQNITGAYDSGRWHQIVQGLETELEGGRRCELCYTFRLEATADEALKRKMDGFTTVLTVSPHKNAGIINEIGLDIGVAKGIRYIPSDFKKKEGFKNSVKLSRELELYRQNYCGCQFSIYPESKISG